MTAMPTNSSFMSHTFRAAGGWWDISLQRQPWETTCEKPKDLQPSWVSVIFLFHFITSPYCRMEISASSKKILNIVVSPENVLTHIPWEQAMNGNLYNENARHWEIYSLYSTNNAFMAIDKYPHKKSQNATCWSQNNPPRKPNTFFFSLTHVL